MRSIPAANCASSHQGPRYQPFLGSAIKAKVLGCDAHVASLSDLVTGKVMAWQDSQRLLSKRKKDEADLIRLAEDYPQVRPLLPEELHRQLLESFGE